MTRPKNFKKTQKNLFNNTSVREESVEDTMQTQNNDGWHNPKIHVSYKEAYEIGSYSNHKLYGYLPETYSSDSRWENALSKGFAKGKFGHNGVKDIEHKLLELKINDDARLYTKEIHQNDRGDFLAIFDNEACHKAIERIVRNSDEIVPMNDCSTFDLLGVTTDAYIDIY